MAKLPHDPSDDEFGPFLTTAQVMKYLPCRTPSAAASWLYRKSIKRRNNGSVAKADVDRALARRSKRGEGLQRWHKQRRAERDAAAAGGTPIDMPPVSAAE